MKFIKPFHGDVEITQNFDDERYRQTYAQYNSKHYGIDFAVPYSSPVLAAADGKVWFSGDGAEEPLVGSQGGLSVILHHGSYLTMYCHLSELHCTKDDQVTAGQLIGLCGDTGLTTGAHLHFSVMPVPLDFSGPYLCFVDPVPLIEGAL
ncbi:M23 family metallopeptidase [Psychromicrobium sp. YIM B11713]|uniref:M23 family metallopeptidase n=1 Tax=Psychromicrobium sp. YIM B11713 TaxID=3145233 RepID=UPI00374F3195